MKELNIEIFSEANQVTNGSLHQVTDDSVEYGLSSAYVYIFVSKLSQHVYAT